MKFLCLLLFSLALRAAACVNVDRDQILASDIAFQLSSFSSLAPNFMAALAPVPGTQRTFSGHELRAIAKRGGVSLEGVIPNLCFKRSVSVLTAEQIKTAILATLRTSDVAVDVVDFSRVPVPSGELSFVRAGLTMPAPPHSAEPALWRGTVRYSLQHTIAVWAHVRMAQERPVLLATRDLRAGNSLVESDIRLLPRSIFPYEPHIEAVAEALGRVLRKTIPAGTILTDALIEAAPDVIPGETVHVVAARGLARISFDAVARTGGFQGDSILLLNPESHRSFRATVDAKGSAHVGPGSGAL